MAITLKNVTLSYPSIFKKAEFSGEETKFQTGIIIKKDSPEYKALKDAYDECCRKAMEEKKLTKSQLTPWIRPLGSQKGIVVDCDEDEEKYSDPRFRNAVVATPKNANRPVVVDRGNHPIVEEDNEIYGGVICNVNVSFYPYSKVYKGIGLQLNGVQKAKDAEPFGAERLTADQMFEASEYDDDIYA